LPRITPSQAQFDAFKNEKVYGVWVNNKKISNKELNNYKHSDFAQVSVSKLYGRAYKGAYTHQVNLMTVNFYEKYLKNALEHPDALMVYVANEGGKK
jgi:bla regulator protein BlaR1